MSNRNGKNEKQNLILKIENQKSNNGNCNSQKEKKNDFKIQNSKRNTSDRNCTKEENDMKI